MPLEMNTTRVFSENSIAFQKGKTLLINQGGTSSSKTYSILQLLILLAFYYPRPFLISVISESYPHLKRGCIRDFMEIMGPAFDEERWSKSEKTYDFGRSQIEFFAVDEPGKMRGGRRDIGFVNEVNNIPKHMFTEFEVRTRKCVIVDFNPVEEFYIHDRIGEEGSQFIHSTYLDAKQHLPNKIIKDIESRKDKDPNWWRVYGMGEVGKAEGLVHPKFQIVESLPEGGIDFYGLDFGYVNDPTALIHCKVLKDELYCDELIYQTDLDNAQISKIMSSLGVTGDDEIFADSAEPKSIEEIRQRGFNIKAAPKGKDSISNGIQLVNQYVQYWTKRSTNGIKEQRNYRYIENSDGKFTGKPIDCWNHSMDARRYGCSTKLKLSSSPFMFSM